MLPSTSPRYTRTHEPRYPGTPGTRVPPVSILIPPGTLPEELSAYSNTDSMPHSNSARAVRTSTVSFPNKPPGGLISGKLIVRGTRKMKNSQNPPPPKIAGKLKPPGGLLGKATVVLVLVVHVYNPGTPGYPGDCVLLSAGSAQRTPPKGPTPVPSDESRSFWRGGPFCDGNQLLGLLF
eukprot:342747-Rhodomonas_salina.1